MGFPDQTQIIKFSRLIKAERRRQKQKRKPSEFSFLGRLSAPDWPHVYYAAEELFLPNANAVTFGLTSLSKSFHDNRTSSR